MSDDQVNSAGTVVPSHQTGIAPAVFEEEERTFARMLDDGAVLVGDRWFPKESSEIERTRYQLSYARRQARNARRRERRRVANGPARSRNVRGCIRIDDASQRTNRQTLERRKCLLRATVARCPLPNEIRTAWHYRGVSPGAKLRLGGLLLDLECFVDNSLIYRTEDGRPEIIGRAPGIRGWINGNCPELARHYKTLMNYRALAKNVRQVHDIPDPVPMAFVLNPELSAAALAQAPLNVQPRPPFTGPEEDGPGVPSDDRPCPCGCVRNRFAWETAPIRPDATGRLFRLQENYRLIAHGADYCLTAAAHLETARRKVRHIILDGPGNRTIENYVRGSGALPSQPSGAAVRATVRMCSARIMAEIRAERRRRERGFWGLVGEAFVAWNRLPYVLTHEVPYTRRELEDLAGGVEG